MGFKHIEKGVAGGVMALALTGCTETINTAPVPCVGRSVESPVYAGATLGAEKGLTITAPALGATALGYSIGFRALDYGHAGWADSDVVTASNTREASFVAMVEDGKVAFRVNEVYDQNTYDPNQIDSQFDDQTVSFSAADTASLPLWTDIKDSATQPNWDASWSQLPACN